MNRGSDMIHRKGMTLLEVLVATAIFATIMVTVGGFLVSASTNISIESHTTTLEQQANRTLNDIASRLRVAKPIGLSAAGASEIKYLVPVDHDGDGDVFNDRLEIEWGCRRPGPDGMIDLLDLSQTTGSSTQTCWQTIRFVKHADADVQESPPELVLDSIPGEEGTYPTGHLELAYSACTVGGISYPELTVELSPANVVKIEVDLDEERGLIGNYYDGTEPVGVPIVTKLDEVIDFDWQDGTPFPALGNDTFSISWTGQIKAPETGTYTFTPKTDDGVRIIIDGDTIVDFWQIQAATGRPGNKDLEKDERYDFQMDYFEASGPASCKLEWVTPTGNPILPVPVPRSVLYPSGSEDEVGEPIFRREGTSIELKICLLDRSDPEHPIVVKARTSVGLKNR